MHISVATIGVLISSLFLACRAPAQVNSWTSSTSGHWEDSSWSLGVLPAASQTVCITNSGYKAVGIFPSTTAEHSGSLTVSNLLLAAPPDGLTTLLLNYAGTAVPLNVLGRCEIDTNATLLNLYSAFEVDGSTSGALFINGGNLFLEGGTISATNGTTILQSGSMALTNGDSAFGTVFIGASGPPGAAKGTMAGGSLSGDFYIQNSNTFSFLDGMLSGILSVGDSSPGIFVQEGGTNTCGIVVGDNAFSFGGGNGQYFLYGGSISNGGIAVAANQSFGSFQQLGGYITTGSIEIGNGNNSYGSFTLANGVLTASGIGIFNGFCTQGGGQVVLAAPLNLQGFGDDYSFRSAWYYLSGGVLSVPAISVGFQAGFNQTGGTNFVAGDLHIQQTSYGLSDGFVSTSNTWIQGGYDVQDYGTFYDPGVFFQSGGTHAVANTLTVLDLYLLGGGTLNASNIMLTGTMAVSNSPVIINSGTFTFGGTLDLTSASVALGQLKLATNSVIDLASSSSVVAFVASSGTAWTARSLLIVSNWNGIAAGGGMSRFSVGSSSNGLTAAQLAQVQFINPSGFAAGRYAAQILPTGEIVPAQAAVLLEGIDARNLVLTWPGGLILQNATNVSGPYLDVGSARSPFSWDTASAPQQFFRLRR
jgi:hypothetical protein